jgi:hypothetical protein
VKTDLTVEIRAGIAAEDLSSLTGAMARQHSIKHAVDWLAAHDPPIAPAGMVTQDEFSHDILVDYPGGLWLVYDTT